MSNYKMKPYDNPKVSIIVATYRREKTLKETLLSLINQTYSNIEIIIVDDNASLKWNKKVKKILNNISNSTSLPIKYICNADNKGSAETRNIGILNSDGEYITFLDDDDLYLPNKVKNQLYHMLQKNSDFSITDMYLYDSNDKLIEKRTRNYLSEKAEKKKLLKIHFMYHLTGPDSMMFRRKYLVNIGMFAPIDVGDDFYLMQRAIEGNGTFSYLPKCDLKAYVHGENGGLSSGEGKINGAKQLYQYKEKYFHHFTKTEINYIRMRHYAVIAFAELRRKKTWSFLINSLLSFVCSPIQAFYLLLEKTNGYFN